MEHGRVMRARVVKDVVLEARCLADILGGCPSSGVAPAISMPAAAAATVHQRLVRQWDANITTDATRESRKMDRYLFLKITADRGRPNAIE